LIPDTKECTKCGLNKPINEFRRKDRNHCKECERAYQNQKKLDQPEQYLYTRAKTRAKKAGKEFNLTLDDLVIPTHCPYLGIPLVISKKAPGPNSPSIDRIDATKGYVKGNVVICSYRANAIKNDATLTELLQIATKLSELKNEQTK
jgi:hypothetical protein